MFKNWHSISLKETFSRVKSSATGLSQREADSRLLRNGFNVLPSEKAISKTKLFLSQFNNFLMVVVLCLVAISFSLKQYSDAIFICVVISINIGVGFYQENKADQSLRALKKMVKINARVLRDGNEKQISNEEMVVGDVIFLRMGDKVPADCRIIDSKNLKVNESSLTGEWLAANKQFGVLEEKTTLAERSNVVFMGTIVEEGWATAVVIATSLSTQIGQIVSLLRGRRETKTPLQNKITQLSKLLGIFIFTIIIITAIIGYFRGQNFTDIFISSLALTVSAIPEGLLPAITVILVLGMRRILKQKGLMRRLAANETLGSVTVICTDKTGTLTTGEMQISHILTGSRELMSDGANHFPKIDEVNDSASHLIALKIAMLANDAFIENPESSFEQWVVRGKPTERALLLAATQAGLNKKSLENRYPVLDSLNFNPVLKYSATLRQLDKTEKIFYVFGAPEPIISASVNLDIDGEYNRLDSSEAKKLFSKVDELTALGLRVVVCAYRKLPITAEYQNLSDLVQGLSLVGFIALKDPLRSDVKEAIAITKKAGIRTIIVTGDHKLTAKTIGQEIGLSVASDQIIEGKDLETMNDEELKKKMQYVSVCARVAPQHKLRIVDALQSNGEVVAMLGDGVNDAPALKAADIGVAVGSGTDVAKEVADLVLLDDGFQTIIKAIEQGRVIFNNIRKVFVYLVADDFSELFLFFGSMALGFPIPLVAAQILWINIIEDGFPSIALTTEQELAGVMAEKPRNSRESILNRPLKLWMIAIFFVTGLAALLSFIAFWKLGGDLDKSRTMVFALMCFDSLVFAFSVRSFKRSIFRRDIFSNRFVVASLAIGLILLMLAIYTPLLQKLLSTQSLAISDWLIILAISLVEIIFLELFKKKIFSKA